MAVQGVSVLILLLLSLFGFCLRATYGDVWHPAHATCYESNATTMGGACGYYNVDTLGYGENTAALSYVLFNNGYTCGACYKIMCDNKNSPSCNPAKSIIVTATNSCPPALPNTPRWCDGDNEHFDLAVDMFKTIAEYKAGIVPVLYQRVPCSRNGGIKFTFTKVSPYFKLVLITNVGGAGDVHAVSVKYSSNEPYWTQLRKNWGQNWLFHDDVDEGRELQFQVTTSDGKIVTTDEISGWIFEQTKTYDGGVQF